MKYLKLMAVAIALIAVGFAARPAQAAGSCWVSPDGSAEVGTTFWISCDGYAPNVYTNVYAVEPDGRASGLNIYGFFPTVVKADEQGVAKFYFKTEFDGVFSTPVGNYVFVIRALGPGGVSINEQHVDITVQSRAENNSSAWLKSTVDAHDVSFWGGGFAPWEETNVWVSSPDGAKCSGLGIDQLTLGALGANSSSLWYGPGTVKADANGDIAFSMHFNPSACIGEYIVTVRAPASWTAGETTFTINGDSVTESGAGWIQVTDMVPAYKSALTVWGGGFHANETVNCWFTRPDGRVLSWLNVNPKTDAAGSFSVNAVLDDFAPFTSTEPGKWQVTCATPDRAHLNVASFTVYGLESAP